MKSQKKLVVLGVTGLSLFLTLLFSSTWAGETSSEENLHRYVRPTLMGPEVSVAPTAGDRAQRTTPSMANGGRGRVPREATVAPEPMWKSLERLSPGERANARIELGLPRDASQAALAHARKVEEAWNGGRYEEALELFRRLAELVDLMEVAVGIDWREPIRSSGADWGGDVQVSAEDAVYDVALDFHAATGHLFVALLYFDGAAWRWSVNFSSDGGQSWSETYSWGTPYHQRDMDGNVVGDYFYVGFTGLSDQSEARMMRFSATDGLRDVAYGIVTVFDATPNSIREVALTSMADIGLDYLYCAAIISNGGLWCYSSENHIDWYEHNTTVANAERGLDACCDCVMPKYLTYVSYIGTADSVYALARRLAAWHYFGNLDFAGTGTKFSSVGAHGDTAIVVFEHVGATHWIKYWITYNAGTSWAWWYVGDTTATSYSPDVTSRRSDGMGVSFVVWQGHQGMYTWRDYPLGLWSTPVRYDDHGVHTWFQPAIEWVATQVYGVAYISFPGQYVYFDRSDWVGVEEEVDARCQMPDARLSQNQPNPFGAGGTTISFNVKRSTLNVSLTVYDLAGRLVRTLVDEAKEPGTYGVDWDGRDDKGEDVAGGVYFYRLSTDSFKGTRKAVVLR